MKGSKVILAACAVALALSASAAWADLYPVPIKKSVSSATVLPVTGLVSHNTIVYTFQTGVAISVRFETIDARYVKLAVKPVSSLPSSFAISLQWSYFSPITLAIGGGGTTDYILDTETGYAEK